MKNTYIYIKKCPGEVAQTMYTHVSKCKNDKIKGERKKCPFLWRDCGSSTSEMAHLKG
jgi:hypothetical protein